MTVLPPELANLPAPTLVEEIGYEVRLALFRTRLVAIFEAAGIDYDVQDLETDPAQILLQVAAYQDMLLRQRINEAVRGTLLPYAAGPDLDILAAFYDVTRLSAESDARLRQRVVLAIRGRSPGGTEPRYRSIALGADPRVADVSVYTVGRDPTVRVAVFAVDNAGVPDETLLAAVDAALQDAAARMVNDRIVVAPAARQVIAVAADVWLLPQAATSVTTAMENALRTAWANEIGLGRDVTRSWIIGKLMINGVHRVDLRQPAGDIVLPFDEAAALGAVTLTIRGRDF
jgi:phage-related baseplate assembly protein